MLSNLWHDIRHAARTLWRSPGFALATTVTIALGVGVNTGVFTVLNGLLFRELPAPDAEELVSIYQSLEGVPNRVGAPAVGLFSTTEYEAYRDRTRTLSGIAGYADPTRTTLGGESSEQIVGTLVTCNYFDVLEQAVAIGRGLRAGDCASDADPVVVLDYELWKTAFRGDADIVGRSIELNRQLLTVIGVASEGAYGGYLYRTGYFAPISAQPLLLPREDGFTNSDNSWLFLIGRRNEGASLAQVRAELSLIAGQIDQDQPGRRTTLRIERATPLSIPLIRNIALGAAGVLMSAFALILLIACANVANLLLARAATRNRETAVRLSLGASRARVAQALLSESALIAVAGGLLGSVLALWSVRLLVAYALPSFSPPGIPPLVLDSSPDVRVLMLAILLTFGTGMLFGLAPALHAAKADLNTVIKQDGASPIGRRRGGRLRGTLVGVQVAMCMTLMIAAGLLLRGLYAARTVDPGFDYANVAVASYDLRSASYSPEQTAAFLGRFVDEARALPGVEAAAYAWRAPLGADIIRTNFRLPGQSDFEARPAELNAVTSDYFSVIGTPIVQGRTFTEAEIGGDARVAIVTESSARNYWPGRDPIGETLLWPQGPDQEIPLQVIGVVKDAQLRLIGEIDPLYVYLPASPDYEEVLLVKGQTDFGATALGIRSAARALDPAVVVRIDPLEANLDYWRNLSRAVTVLGSSLGGLALALAAVGIFGVVSYAVSSRSREIGIRMALGAKARDVLALILRQTMGPVAIGAAIGIAAALGLSGILSSVLFGVSPVDPVGLGGAAIFVLGIALAAGNLAARPALRADPTETLRSN